MGKTTKVQPAFDALLEKASHLQPQTLWHRRTLAIDHVFADALRDRVALSAERVWETRRWTANWADHYIGMVEEPAPWAEPRLECANLLKRCYARGRWLGDWRLRAGKP